MKKILILVIVLIIIAGGGFFYLTRPVAAPSSGEILDDNFANVGLGAKVQTYQISSTASKIEFYVDEVLRGNEETAVGTTPIASGQFRLVEENNTKSLELGTIRINARTFQTGSDKRDSMIARFILRSEEAANEFIVFKPKDVIGLPDSISLDTEQTFQVLGDLTIAGVTKEAWFEVVATFSETEILAIASTTVLRSAFDLNIPKVESVASVADEVFINASIVADKVSN